MLTWANSKLSSLFSCLSVCFWHFSHLSMSVLGDEWGDVFFEQLVELKSDGVSTWSLVGKITFSSLLLFDFRFMRSNRVFNRFSVRSIGFVFVSLASVSILFWSIWGFSKSFRWPAFGFCLSSILFACSWFFKDSVLILKFAKFLCTLFNPCLKNEQSV